MLIRDGRVVGDLLGCEHVGNHTITLVLEMGSVNLEVLGHSEVPMSAATVVKDDHGGFGSDFDGFNGGASCGELPQVAQIVLDRGFSEETILKLWDGNSLRTRDARGAKTCWITNKKGK